jgi:hypothetical protein
MRKATKTSAYRWQEICELRRQQLGAWKAAQPRQLALFELKEDSHSVEIRPDAMIVDGEDVFYAEDIGDNWPALQMKDDDPNRMVICGISGTRFIEYTR